MQMPFQPMMSQPYNPEPKGRPWKIHYLTVEGEEGSETLRIDTEADDIAFLEAQKRLPEKEVQSAEKV